MTSMNKTLYINDIALSDYGIYCSSDTYLNAPSIDYSEYQIPARTGTLIQYNKRLNNVLRVFSCICRKETYRESLAELKRLLYLNTGYVKLVSDYDVNLYQYGYYADDLNIDCVEHEDVVMFELTFSCNPKKYFLSETATTIQPEYFVNILNNYSNEIVAFKQKYAGNTNFQDSLFWWKIAVESNGTENSVQLTRIENDTVDDLFCFFCVVNKNTNEIISTAKLFNNDSFTFVASNDNIFYFYVPVILSTFRTNIRYLFSDGKVGSLTNRFSVSDIKNEEEIVIGGMNLIKIPFNIDMTKPLENFSLGNYQILGKNGFNCVLRFDLLQNDEVAISNLIERFGNDINLFINIENKESYFALLENDEDRKSANQYVELYCTEEAVEYEMAFNARRSQTKRISISNAEIYTKWWQL